MILGKDAIRIGTRGSSLALAQAESVAEGLRKQGFKVEICPIRTTGDRILDLPLPQLGGKGVFVKEIEEALLSGGVQLAVHSLKDLPTELPEGLCLASVPPRESPFDVLILCQASPANCEEGESPLDLLPQGARVGTSSLRRAAQLLNLRPDLEIVSLRGNLDTRLRKLRTIPLDAIVVGAAGIHRLPGVLSSASKGADANLVVHPLAPEICTPAAGQGALGIEARADDSRALQAAISLEDSSARACVEAERAFLGALGGGCRVPIGALAEEVEGSLTLVGVICSIDGKRVLRRRLNGRVMDAKGLGIRLAEQILEAGGREILLSIEDRLQG